MDRAHFSTESYAQDQRGPAWQARLLDARLHFRAPSDAQPLHGTLLTHRTPGGIELSVIASTPQTVSARAGGERGFLLVMLLDGQAALTGAGVPEGETLVAGDMACIPGTHSADLVARTPFRLISVHVRHALIAPRLGAAPPTHACKLPERVSGLFGGLLSGLALQLDTMQDTDPHALEPAERVILECLASALTAVRPQASHLSTSRTIVFTRICHRIQARLAEPDLSLSAIAKDEHVSDRYLRKLFEDAGQSFSSYLRNSRLQRCHADLQNPAYEQLTVADICYRWGFNDPSYFSQAFRERFGVSPKASRDQALRERVLPERARISRGHPDVPAGLAPHAPHAAHAAHARLPSHDATPGGDALRGALPHDAGRHHYLRATCDSVHWGYLSHDLAPVLTVASGDTVTIETLTQHATDDWARMIEGDPGAESVFHWTATQKNVDRRGAGPMDASVYGRGAGEGFGVHICTGPIAVEDAMPGDVLEVRILDLQPRPSANPEFAGKAFGSHASTWWGFHYQDMLTLPREREVVTVFEIDCHDGTGNESMDEGSDVARAIYSFRWTPQQDPFGVVHPTIDYPGVPVDHTRITKNYRTLRNVEIPLRPHFGVLAVAPAQDGLIDSIPPSSYAGNLDNWRVTRGASVFLKVAVPGALLSIGDPHASQGDAELGGTAIECSLTGNIQLILHKKAAIEASAPYADLTYPLVETPTEWIIHGFSSPNHLAELGQKAQSQIYMKSTLDSALRDAFLKARRFLMQVKRLTEDEATAILSVSVDFGVTQVVNGNWGVHAIIRKGMFND
ncbi:MULTISPECIES: acetamidase/formamidase family protein [Pandoraea]|uniref:acetamidase/formamidase family protein n=1 Tax=Pandoraea TaxID=93217 RepID=UPI001F5E234F|nr:MULTISPECIES: acetamidase/formamidase family protein [Pandoraea]MCI3206693.1 AraC family transcriptional regulator [Pandoraea sp. LA3]MDN4584721.1 AraC family transcriptional regulator [Pandoraea capi]